MQRMHWQLIGMVGMLLATSGCLIESTTLKDGFIVRGVAAGLLMPVILELETAQGSETLTVPKDGPFEFEKFFFNDGDSFAVTILGELPCQVEGASDGIRSADAMLQLNCLLTSLRVSGPTDALNLAAGQAAYTVPVSVLQQSASVIVVAAVPEVEISVGAEIVTSGVASEPVALALGDNHIQVTAMHAPSGWMRTFDLTVTRGKAIAQAAYGKASNASANDELGISVALAGDTLAIGAWQEDSSSAGIDGDQTDDSAAESGAVYVFRRSGSIWQQEAYIKASNTGAADRFGYSVALAGETLAVGAIGEDSNATGINNSQGDNSALSSGAVYVFRRTGSMWQQEAYVKASNTNSGDSFGASVSLSSDTLAVGALGEASNATGIGGSEIDNSVGGSGAVYVFRRTGSTWQQEAYVKAFNTGLNDQFGISVSLSGDTLAVGAALEDSNTMGINGDQINNNAADSGAVYIYQRTGSTWQTDSYIKASNTGGGDNFGLSVSLSGNMLAVGAYREDSNATGVNSSAESDNSATNSGAVYIFRRPGSTWQQEAYIKASNTDASDQFGYSVAISSDALAVSAVGEASINGDPTDNNAGSSGAVYVFQRTGGMWQQGAYIKASNTGGGDSFGSSIALTDDTLAVGANAEDSGAIGLDGDGSDNSSVSSGAVYLFH